MLTIRLLGVVQIRLNEVPVPTLVQGRIAALLAYLCISGRPQSRSVIANLLWNVESEQQARRNLRYTLRDLRKALGDYIEVEGEYIAFNHSLPHWVDCVVFANHIAAVSDQRTPQGSEIQQELLSLYVGDFLDGFQIADAPLFEEWAAAQRVHLREFFARGLEQRIRELVATGDYEGGLALNRHLLSLEPWREEAHRQRMVLLAHLGQRSAALKHYETCCQVLVEELDVAPMPQTTALYEQIKSGEWFTAQPNSDGSESGPAGGNSLLPPVGSAGDHRLGAYLNGHDTGATRPVVHFGSMPELLHFGGRQDDLALMRHWIGQDRCRLFVVLGLPGAGKSALAAAFVQEVCEDGGSQHLGFQQIVWQSLSAPFSCVETLQGWLAQLEPSAKDIPTSNIDQLIGRLFHLLKERRCLLVLDGVDEEALESTPDVDAYNRLFRLFFQREHRSCLVLTSRSRPSALTLLDERDRAFRWLQLGGLGPAEGVALLREYGLGAERGDLEQLCRHYAGNPLLLTQVANLIHELFDGNVAAFLRENLYFLGEIGTGLYRYLSKLPPAEARLLHCLADMGTPTSREVLWQAMQSDFDRSTFLLALRSLQNLFLIQVDKESIDLPLLLLSYFQEHRLLSHAR